MAYYSHEQNSSLWTRVRATAAHIVEQAKQRYAHHRVYRASLIELSALSDRDLADLGLSRSMLRSVARTAADAKFPL